MIKKIINKSKLLLFPAILIAFPAMAAVNFIADGNIAISDIVYGDAAVDMTILDGSSAESITYDSGTFKVNDPNSFKLSCNDSSVQGISATLSGAIVACMKNSDPGISYITLPNNLGEYIIEPIATNLSNALTYNSSCGAATCEAGYSVSGRGADAICVHASGALPLQRTNCSSVVYGEWQNSCFNGWQYRNIKSQSPSGCSLTSSQENSRKRQCSSLTPIAPENNTNQTQPETTITQPTSQANQNPNLIANIIAEAKSIIANQTDAQSNFTANGTQSTLILGQGERKGVIESFKSAFGKTPTTQTDWEDIIKIANGRWPSQTNKETEKNATDAFKKIYKRNPDRTNPKDDAAVTIISYGLRPAQRNLNSEKQAIISFKNIYGYAPKSASAWDIVRAIAYSGAKR